MGRIGRSAPKPTQMVASAMRSGSIGPHWASQARARSVTDGISSTAPHRIGGGGGRGRAARPATSRQGVTAAGPAYDRERMSPVLLLVLLAAALVALIPVWRLRVAGWPARWL